MERWTLYIHSRWKPQQIQLVFFLKRSALLAAAIRKTAKLQTPYLLAAEPINFSNQNRIHFCQAQCRTF